MFWKRYKKTIVCVALFLIIAVVAILSIVCHAWYVLDTPIYVYNEYDSSVSFEEAKGILEENGYLFTEMDFPKIGSEKSFWILHESDTKKTYWTQVVVYETVSQAKTVYQKALHGEDSRIPAIFTQTRSLYRVNSCVYFTKNAMHVNTDILISYGLDIPEATPLVRCGGIEKTDFTYDAVCQSMDALGYSRYSDALYNDVFRTFEYVISPEHNSCFLLVHANTPLSQKQREEAYKALLPVTAMDYLGTKMVMLSEDAFIVGDEHTIDMFFERMTKSK